MHKTVRTLEAFAHQVVGMKGAVSQITSVVERNGMFHVIRISDERAPCCDADLFLLHLMRSNVNAILTSGMNMADEPGLCFRSPREAVKGKDHLPLHLLGSNTPQPCLLTLEKHCLSHCMFTESIHRPIVLHDSAERHAALQLHYSSAKVACILLPPSSSVLVSAITHLRSHAYTISIESGPSLTASLSGSALPNTLVLCTYAAPIPEAAIGPPWIPASLLSKLYTPLCVFQDGPWGFRLFSAGRLSQGHKSGGG